MTIIIETKDIKPRQDLLALLRKKAQKFSQLNHRLIETRVFLKLDKSDTTQNRVCEIRIAIPGNDLFAEKRARTFPDAVRKAAEAMNRQIIDWRSTVRPYRKSRLQATLD
jgi:ribosome hibernation promoting factor